MDDETEDGSNSTVPTRRNLLEASSKAFRAAMTHDKPTDDDLPTAVDRFRLHGRNLEKSDEVVPG
jgi:hypothetical protein